MFFLQTNGSGVLSFSSPSSDFVLLATTDASSSSSVSFDGYFSSTYKNYQVILSSVYPATNSVNFRIRYRRSNADVTASNYNWTGAGSNLALDGTTSAVVDFSQASQGSIQLNNNNLGNSNNFQYNSIIDIYDPLNTSRYKVINWKMGVESTNSFFYYVTCFGVLKDSTAALSGITFYMSSGNIASGNFKLYGIK